LVRFLFVYSMSTFLFQDHLINFHSDDTTSIKLALKIYSLSSIYYGTFESTITKAVRDLDYLKYTFKNKLCGTKNHPRFILIEQMRIQIEVNHNNNNNKSLRNHNHFSHFQ